MAETDRASGRVAWGVLGCAKIALTKVIPAMQQGEVAHIAAIASRDADRARAAAERLGIATSHGSYEALLADPAIQAIYNPLPNHLHVPWTIRALEAGKHVLCEKPLGLTAEDAARIIAVRDRTGLVVAEAFMVAHHPQWQRVQAIVTGGQIGQARAVQTFFSYTLTDPANIRNKPEIGGGGLMDIGCYAIFTARLIFAAEPERVMGLFEHDPTMGTDRLTSGLLAFPGGRQAVFTCSTQLTPHQHVTIAGTKGRIEIEIPFNAPPDRPCRIIIDDGRDLFGGGRVVEAFAPCDQYTLQGDAVSRTILGDAVGLLPIEDGISTMRVIDALVRSGRSGQWETP